jgi:hypothetical protein
LKVPDPEQFPFVVAVAAVLFAVIVNDIPDTTLAVIPFFNGKVSVVFTLFPLFVVGVLLLPPPPQPQMERVLRSKVVKSRISCLL